jgi:hypothetical protein
VQIETRGLDAVDGSRSTASTCLRRPCIQNALAPRARLTTRAARSRRLAEAAAEVVEDRAALVGT